MEFTKWICLTAFFCFIDASSVAFAQDGKTEIALFGGGYFNSGFQSFKILNPVTGAQTGTVKPIDEANSGIFGTRASYAFRPQMAFEGTFGFSPAGRTQQITSGVPIAILSPSPQQTIAIPISTPVMRDGNVYLYSGSLLTYFNQQGTWRPFFTVGGGAVTRTSKIAFIRNPLPIAPAGTIGVPIFFPVTVPSTTRTDMALVLGAGVKKFLPHRLGVRLDFRDYINKVNQSTVNSMELSLGVFTHF